MADAIRSQYHICLTMLADNIPRRFLVEESANGCNTFALGDGCHIGTGLHTEMTDPQRNDALEQRSVVAADFHDERIGGRQPLARNFVCHALKVCGHPARTRCEKRVLWMK